MDEVGALDGLDLVAEEAAQQPELQVGFVLVSQGVEELVGQDRDLRGVDAGELVDVDDLVGGDGLVDELADGGVDLDGAGAAAAGVGVENLQDGRADVGEHADVVADGGGLVAGPGERVGLGEGEHLVEEAFLPIGVGHHEVEDLGVLGQPLGRRAARVRSRSRSRAGAA